MNNLVKDWDPNVSYKRGNIVEFHNKIYLCLSENVGVIPIPVVNEDGNNLFGYKFSNLDQVTKIVELYFIDNVENHLNINKSWVTIR